MTRAFSLFFLLLVSLLAVAQKKKTFIITNVTLIPMNAEQSLPSRTVVIEKGKITRIEGTDKSRRSTPAITVIDGTGKYLVPGLFDMHAHFFHEQGEYKNTCEAELKMMLANGLATVRIRAGHPAYKEAREAKVLGQ